jgi:hypothetical protein
MHMHHIPMTSRFGTMRYVRPLKWSEVKDIWRGNEEHLEHWQKYWEAQGHKSWEDWRKKFFWRFNTAKADWSLYKVINPRGCIPALTPGQFRGWRKLFYQNLAYSSFAELAMNRRVLNHPPVKEFKEHLKNLKETTIIGLWDSDLDVITVIEGMHRCVALTASIIQSNFNEEEPKTEFYIALGAGKERWLSRMLYRLGFI